MEEFNLDNEVMERLWRRIKKNRIRLILLAVGNIVGFIALYCFYWITRGSIYANENIFQDVTAFIVLEGIGFIFYILYLAFIEIPNKIVNEEKNKVATQGTVNVELVPFPQNGHASLKIINNELFELTECYATLNEIKHPDYILDDLLMEINRGGVYLSWSGGKATSEGKKNIPAKSKTLAINIATTEDGSIEEKPISELKFLFHDHYPTISTQGCFDVVVHLHGKKNGKEFEPIEFIGHFEYSSVYENDTLVTGLYIYKGKCPAKQINPQAVIIERFSTYLDQAKEERTKKSGWNITGLGLIFLEKAKSAPPFLGLEHKQSIISKAHELELTEFIRAYKYKDRYYDSIRGGITYTVKDGDNSKKIAKVVYGKENYEQYVISGVNKISVGLVLSLPYINLDNADHHDFIKKQLEIYKTSDKVASMLHDTYNLVEDEAIAILMLVYDAAQMTLNEQKGIKGGR